MCLHTIVHIYVPNSSAWLECGFCLAALVRITVRHTCVCFVQRHRHMGVRGHAVDSPQHLRELERVA